MFDSYRCAQSGAAALSPGDGSNESGVRSHHMPFMNIALQLCRFNMQVRFVLPLLELPFFLTDFLYVQRHLVTALASRLQECTVRIAAATAAAEANALMGTARAQARMLAVILFPPAENFDASASSVLRQFVSSHAVADVDSVAEPIDLIHLMNCARRAGCSMAALPWVLDFLRCCR
jgi:hypothetical protein